MTDNTFDYVFLYSLHLLLYGEIYYLCSVFQLDMAMTFLVGCFSKPKSTHARPTNHLARCGFSR